MARFSGSADQADIDERDAAPSVVRRKQRVHDFLLHQACDKFAEAALMREAGITEGDLDGDS